VVTSERNDLVSFVVRGNFVVRKEVESEKLCV